VNYAMVGHGRMGLAVDAHAARRGHERVAVFDSPGLSLPSNAEVDVVFEFTEAAAAERNVVELLESGHRVVCGTTGWSVGAAVARALAQGGGALILSPNFSVSVRLFGQLAARTAAQLGRLGGFDAFVHEHHHRAKLDNPSGTARWLAQLVIDQQAGWTRSHEGHADQPLSSDTLHVVGTRAGHEPGTHTVGFDGEFEEITLRHRSRSRDGFALGAVLAAEWLNGRQGRFEFDRVIDDLIETDRGENGS